MAHQVNFTVPERDLGPKDISFKVMVDDELLGTLYISKGGVQWYPRKTSVGHKLNWLQFDTAMVEYGKKAARRSPMMKK